MENLFNDRQHPWNRGSEGERERERERNESRERDKYRARERQRRRDRRGSARVAKVDYILLSQPATCCTLGRTGLPGKSNHR